MGIQDCSTDPYTLLTPALFDLVETGTIEEFAEYERHLFRDDPGAVILDDDPENIARHLLDADIDVGKDFGFLACIEGIVDRLLDGRDNAPGRGIEAEKVFIFLEKFCNTDTSL